MKNCMLFFSFFIFCLSAKQLCGQTNVYHPLPDSGYYWNVLDLYGNNFGGAFILDTLSDGFRKYTITGDTTVGSNIYKKIFVEGGELPHYFQGYYRDDSVNKTVYLVTDDFLSGSISGDTLLWDFNVEIGDSVNYSYEFDRVSNPQAVVTNVDSVEIEGSYRKRIQIQYHINFDFYDGYDTVYWIDGIGSTSGFTLKVYPPPVQDFQLFADRLTCVRKVDSTVFENLQDWYTCDSLLKPLVSDNIIDHQKENNSFIIYPQPADAFIHIKNNQDIYFDHINIEITNLVGEIQKVIHVGNFKIVNADVNNLESGLYILRIVSSENLLAKYKIIISH